jgi:hypothetical protein
MSTAVERIMRERGDFSCLHEPFMYDYYIHRQVRRMPLFEPEAGRPVSYAAIRDDVLARAEHEAVFFKDMSYYVMPEMRDDAGFAGRLTHAFLIRDPRRSILSYHKLDPELSCEEIGLEAQWRHFAWLRDSLGMAPMVLEAETVQADSRAAMRHWWSGIGLDFVEGAFTWNGDAAPADWGQVSGWHGDVQQSTSIRPAARRDEATFDAEFEAAAQEAPRLRQLLAHHLPFYERLRVVAEAALDGI